jgi:hypothetical protein
MREGTASKRDLYLARIGTMILMRDDPTSLFFEGDPSKPKN